MKRCQYWLLYAITYYPMSVGYTTLNIDFKRKRLKLSKFWQFYAFVDNLIVLAVLPIAILVNLNHVRFNGRNQVLAFANFMIILSRLFLILEVIIKRRKRDGKLKQCLLRVLVIQTTYFDRFHNLPHNKSLRKLIALNAILMVVHVTNVFCRSWMNLAKNGWWIYMDNYLICIVLVWQHSIMIQHAMLLCFLYESLFKINYQIEWKIQDPKLSIIYYHLTSLIEEFNVIYSPVNMWTQLCSIVTNSMMGYFCVLFLLEPHIDLASYSYVMGDGSYILLCIHMNIYFLICNQVITAFRRTNVILRNYINADRDMPEVSLFRFCFCNFKRIIFIFSWN